MKSDLGFPPESGESVDIEYLPGHSVRLGAVKDEFCSRMDHVPKRFSELPNGDVHPRPHVDVTGFGVMLHEEETGIGEVVDVEELASGSPEPQISTCSSPLSFASWNFRMRAGRTWLLDRSKLSFGP